MRFPPLLAAVLVCAVATPALALESCELSGQHVNPSNGNTFEDGSRKAYRK